MSQYLTMQLEHEGPAKRVAGDLESDDLFFANNLPYAQREVGVAARVLGVPSVFDFAYVVDVAREAAEVAVYGKLLEQFDEDDSEPTAEMDEAVERITYSSGIWFTVDEGRRAARALRGYFENYKEALEHIGHMLGVIEDLQQFCEALDEAERRGRRFRLRYSY